MQAELSRPPPPSPASSVSSKGLGHASFSYTAPSVPQSARSSSIGGMCWSPGEVASTRISEYDVASRRKLAAYAAWLAETGAVSQVGAGELIRTAQDKSIEDPEASVHRTVLVLLAEHGGSDCRGLASWVLERWLSQQAAPHAQIFKESASDLQGLPTLKGKKTLTMSAGLYQCPNAARTFASQHRPTRTSKAAARWLVGALLEMTKPPLREGMVALCALLEAPATSCAKSDFIPKHDACSSTPLLPMRAGHGPSSPHFGMWTPILPTWWDTGPEEERSWLQESARRSGYLLGTDMELMADSPYWGSAGGSITDMASPFAKLQSPPISRLVPHTKRYSDSDSPPRPWAEEGLPLNCQQGTQAPKDDDSTVDWLMQRWSLMKHRRRNESSMSAQPSPCKGPDIGSPQLQCGPPRPGGRWPAGPARALSYSSNRPHSVDLSSPSQVGTILQQHTPGGFENQQGVDTDTACSSVRSSASTCLPSDDPSNLVLETSSTLVWSAGQGLSRRPTTARQSSLQLPPAATHPASLGMASSAVALARASAAASRIRASLGSATSPSVGVATSHPTSSSPPRSSAAESSFPQTALSPSCCRSVATWSGSQRLDFDALQIGSENTTHIPTPTRNTHKPTEMGIRHDVAASTESDLGNIGVDVLVPSDRQSMGSNHEGCSRSASLPNIASSSSGPECESASTRSSSSSMRRNGRIGAASSSCEVFFIGTPRCL